MKKLYFVLIALALAASACQLGGVSKGEPTPIPLIVTAAPTPVVVMNPTTGPQGGKAPEAGTTRVSPSDGMIQIYIPDGTFMRGGVDADAPNNETPIARITMTGFWMDKVEITNGMYKLCYDANVCALPHYLDEPVLKSNSREDYFLNTAYADYPVIYVTWADADTYCKWAGRRMPTEAEWEYSARGVYPSQSVFPWGDKRPEDSMANFNYSTGDTMPVGSYPAGASIFGILDLAGNVAEWVYDFYDVKYYDQAITLNPKGPISGTNEFLRVVRGGHWADTWKAMRVSYRTSMMGSNPDKPGDPERYFGVSNNSVGFRCAAGN